jgi:alpha-beta hydrolase superfamily lysophospholipase
MSDASFTHRVPDGTNVHVHGFAPDAPRAVLHILHGMGEHGARYARLAATMNDAGFAVYAHDHRGHGRSVANPADLGHLGDEDGFLAMVRDAHAVNRAIAAKHPGLPIVMLAHSMGSFVAQVMLFSYPDDFVGCALSGSSGAPPLLAKAGRVAARVERARLGKRGKSPLLTALTFGDFNKKFAPNRTDFDWLSRDQAEVDKYIADPLCGFASSTQSWIDLLDALDTIVHEPSSQARIPKDMPVYLFAGDKDPVGDMGAGVRKLHDEYRRAGLVDLAITLYPNARHETLNETNRDQVTADLLAFARRVAGL